MFLKLTAAQMLDRWRLHTAYSPLVIDAVFRRNDGIDTDAILTAEMNRWYHRLLREAPEEYLCAEEFAPKIPLPEPSDGCYALTLPPEAVRVLEVRLSSWRSPARIVTSATHPLAARQLHPFTRATPSHPVAVFAGGVLRLYPASAADSLATLRCVTFREGEYAFDDSALAGMQS